MVVHVGSFRVDGMWEGAWNMMWRSVIGRVGAGVRGGSGGPRQWDLEMGVQSQKEPGGKGRFRKGLDFTSV